MNLSDFPWLVSFHPSSIMRSVIGGMSAGVLLMMLFGGCSEGPSPPSGQAKAPAPSPDAATAGLPQTVLDAKAEIPAWAGQQQDEPFNVRQFLEGRAIPANNAAPLYLAALAEISADMYVSNPPASWPWDAKNVPAQVRDLNKVTNDLGDHDKLLQGSVSEADIESLLTKAQPALKKFDEAQQRPRCVFVGGIRYDSLLPHLQSTRQFVRLQCVQLQHARLKGSFDEAEQAIRRSLRLSRDVRPRGAIIAQLVSCVLDRMILAGISDFTLGQQGLTSRDCDRLLTLLSEHEREGVSSADEALRMEYVTLRDTLDSLQQGRMSPKQLAQLLTDETSATDVEQRLSQVNWQAEITACNRAFAAAIALAAVPYDRAQTGQWAGVEIPKVKAQNAVVTLLLLPAVDGVFEGIVRSRTQLAGVQCLTAVRRYALANGSLPSDLEVAVREAGLKAVPTDSYSGRPMLYKVIDGKPVVYSVGRDRKDDGGVVDWNNGQQPGDFIFRIRE